VLGGHADGQVQRTPAEEVQHLVGGGDGQPELDVGSLAPEGAERLGEVVDGGHVDHPDPQQAGPARPPAVDPPGQFLGVGQHPLGVADDGPGLVGQHPAPARRLEQRHPDPPLELGQALGQRRRRDADGGRGPGEGGLVGCGDEVLELLHGHVGQDGIVHAPTTLLQSSFIGTHDHPPSLRVLP
jgi:hypothetical protein